MKNTFEYFDEGKLILWKGVEELNTIPWLAHPTFEGVELKHLITSKESQGIFSYHLVRIEPHKKIGHHSHQDQIETHEVIGGNGTCTLCEKSYQYFPGMITLFPKNEIHEIVAGEKGLYLLAKFFPALC